MSDWKTRIAARLDDMSGRKKSLRVVIQEDGDVTVIIDVDGMPAGHGVDASKMAIVEFCNPVGGGGMSRNTRRALIVLFEAMKLDAEERPEAIPEFPRGLKEAMERDTKEFGLNQPGR